MRGFALALLTLACVSCSSPMIREFEVVTLNASEQNVRCVVMVDNRIQPNSLDPLVTNQKSVMIKMQFTEDPIGIQPYKPITVSVRPVDLDAEGKPIPGSWEKQSLPYEPASRDFFYNDPEVEIFFLKPRRR